MNEARWCQNNARRLKKGISEHAALWPQRPRTKSDVVPKEAGVRRAGVGLDLWKHLLGGVVVKILPRASWEHLCRKLVAVRTLTAASAFVHTCTYLLGCSHVCLLSVRADLRFWDLLVITFVHVSSVGYHLFGLADWR
jgi:hypothetical protein